MSALSKSRAGSSKLDVPDERAGEATMLIYETGLAGKFQESSPIKFNHESSKWQFWVHLTFETAWILYLMFLVVTGIIALTYVSPDTIWPYQTWTWLLVGATGWMFLWFVSAFICSLRNKWAVDKGASELPCMQLRYTVSYMFFLLAGWAVVLGFTAELWANESTPVLQSEQTSYITKVWLIVLVASLNLLDPLRHLCGMARDRVLFACKSTWHDL